MSEPEVSPSDEKFTQQNPDDALPPVEPPSAGLLLQLFVVPAVIVLLIVVVYIGLFQLFTSQADPKVFVERIDRNNTGSWQAASDLADRLRNPADKEIRKDRELALAIAQILERELGEASLDKHEIEMRMFLCKALGEFEIDSGLPALLQAAGPPRRNEEKELRVRYAALEAIALTADRNRENGGLKHPKLIPTLLEASRAEQGQVRLRAAFAMGLVDDPQGKLRKRLLEMTHRDMERNADARYNAVIALARQGEPTVLGLLEAMLEPDAINVDRFDDDVHRQWYRALILKNALIGLRELKRQQPELDTGELLPLVDALKDYPAAEVKKTAQEVAAELRGETPAKAKPQ